MFRTIYSTIAAAALVVGCGGGGGDEPPQQTTDFAVAAAMLGLATGTEEVFDMAGNFVGEAATLHAVHTPMSDAPFGTFGLLNRMRRTVTLSTASMSVVSYEEDFFDLAQRTFFGIQTDEGQAVSTARAPYPATAHIGDSGLLFDGDEFDAATGGMIGKSHVTWSLEATGAVDQAFLCINSQYRDASGAPTGMSEKDCYRIDPAGQRLGMRVTLVLPALGTFVFQ